MIGRILCAIALTTTVFVSAMAAGAQGAPGTTKAPQGYAGSSSCRECHEKSVFYTAGLAPCQCLKTMNCGARNRRLLWNLFFCYLSERRHARHGI